MPLEKQVNGRIAAGSMMHDSWDIAPTLIAHLVLEGIRDFYLIDHRSTEDRRDEFLRQIPVEARIHWMRKESPLYAQAASMTALAHLARHDGFDAFVPFDSDEFFVAAERTLAEEICEWLDTTSTRALRCRMENFYQSREVERFAVDSLKKVRYRALSGEISGEHFANINPEFSRYPFSRRQFKTTMRLVPGVDGDFDWLSMGNHNVLTSHSGDKYESTESTVISVLHLPCRSREGLTSRRTIRFRHTDNAGTSLDSVDGEALLSDAVRDAEWNMASVPTDEVADEIQINGVLAVRDDRLANRGPAIAAALRNANSDAVPYIDIAARMANVALDLAHPVIQLAKASAGRSYLPIGARQQRDLERKIRQLEAKLARHKVGVLRRVVRKLRGSD